MISDDVTLAEPVILNSSSQNSDFYDIYPRYSQNKDPPKVTPAQTGSWLTDCSLTDELSAWIMATWAS